jgi:hypothetical protein
VAPPPVGFSVIAGDAERVAEFEEVFTMPARGIVGFAFATADVMVDLGAGAAVGRGGWPIGVS